MWFYIGFWVRLIKNDFLGVNMYGRIKLYLPGQTETQIKYKMSQPRKSLLNPIHPEIAKHLADRRKFGFTHPLDFLQLQLSNTAELININDGDYYTAGEETKASTSEFLTGIQNDVIQLANRVFQQMLFPKLIHLITESKGSCGSGQCESANWELIAVNTNDTNDGSAYPSATFCLHSWWRGTGGDQDENKEYCRLVILSNPGDGTATARIEDLAADLKTVITSDAESTITKYDDLSKWVRENL
jgi:hypothetical protein